jgi:hypothetical protein
MVSISKKDRTADVEANRNKCLEIIVKSTDYCLYFKRHPYTILWRKECWTCNFSDFGIETGIPLETGRCMYRFQSNR